MSTAGTAQRQCDEERDPALRLQAAERLAAHRARRAPASTPRLFEEFPHSLDTKAGRIAAAVAERYAQSQSYRAFLAEAAERAHAGAERARAAAEVARRTAEAVAAVQMQLLEELEEIAAEERAVEAASTPVRKPATEPARPDAKHTELTVRLYEVPSHSGLTGATANAVPFALLDEEERVALDEEIAFRQAPVFEDFSQAAVPLPANLIEFPRQLVAARKARPRLAEGPLREEEERAGYEAQLRIFEVESELISTVVAQESAVPEWGSIRLEACQVATPVPAPEYPVSYPHRALTASMELRVMALVVDSCVLLATSVGFAAIAVYLGGHVPPGEIAGISAAVTLATLATLYYILCFTLSDATPGMRYARISFCTLDDENPSRAAIRRRLPAMLLAACPLGLGFLWAFVDDEGLGWHDRMSRMYPRSY